MALRPFRWLPHNGRRHAINADATPDDHTATLCGEELTVPASRATKDEWCWPTCPRCDAAWRTAEGIPTFPRRTSHKQYPITMM
ncbi:hypothetical protein ALI22I_00980 [Saccharothrix sp. ALI-22-I]|uniref:zinc finger protein n=1 Tax=Saccharothrix sp. ALI-22-I TaxID=1933778 RepID=UPI00097C5099|nr:zinc finger protein [Saccharothrix sp. ALI-22-I]ONI92953.1 hypothetical protein ALI22I_00980 [Saccharothrix sp. ALI-22-I]